MSMEALDVFATTEDVPQKQLHVIFSSKGNEWYTPSVYVESARKVMGIIDIDPASSFSANKVVRAKTYYDIDANGLNKKWIGNVWLNPPYGATKGKSNQGIWARKLIEEYTRGNTTQAVLLVNAKTDTRWFELLWGFPICFTSGRVNFYTAKRTTTIGNTNGSCFVYLGPNEAKFIEVFSQFGTIAKRVSPPKPKPVTLSLWEGKE